MKKIINILGDITSQPKQKTDVSAEMIMSEISGLNKGDEIEVNINSYGGEVFEAVAIANLFANSQSSKVFNILGICASAATMLFGSDDEVNIFNGAMVMYHKPQVAVSGDSVQLRKTAKLLDRMEKENILSNLAIRTGKADEELSMLISNEWWLTSDEAVNILGFKGTELNAIINDAKTSNIKIYNNYMSRKKALASNAYQIFINHKNSLK